MGQGAEPAPGRRRAYWAAAAAVALAVFAADLLSPLQGAVAVLYVIAVLLAARAGRATAILAAGTACALLAVAAFLADHLGEPLNAAHVRLGVSLVAIAAVTLLSLAQQRAEAGRHEARARLEQASAELAHAARVSTLGQLAASIAHEVNQPLSAIITYGKSGRRWLSREVPDLEEADACLENIVANGTRAADVIARVRALARKDAPEAGPLALDALVEETVALVQREARAAKVTLRLSEAGPIPAAIGDRVQVQQVLVNLMMNAIQAMREVEGRPRRLLVALAPDGADMVRVSVGDSGTGIAGDPANIFQPFFTTKEDGMGMGLSISRSIVEAQGGRIEAANNPDHGATISFTLPLHTSV